MSAGSSKIRVARRSLRSGLGEVRHGETGLASLFALLQGPPLGPAATQKLAL